MKAMELRAKSPDELTGILTDLKKEQFNLRFQKASGQLENTSRVRQVRREIAAIKTVLVEKKNGKKVSVKEAKPAQAKPAAKKAAAKTTKTAAKKPAAKKAPAKKAAQK